MEEPLDLIGCVVVVGMGPDFDDPEDVDAVARLYRLDSRRREALGTGWLDYGEQGPELAPIGRFVYAWAHGVAERLRWSFQRSPSGHWKPGRGLDAQRCYGRWLDADPGSFRFARVTA